KLYSAVSGTALFTGVAAPGVLFLGNGGRNPLFRRNFTRFPVRSNRNVSEACLGHLDADHVPWIPLREDLDVDGDRRPADPDDRRIEAHDVADQHRLLEYERVDTDLT